MTTISLLHYHLCPTVQIFQNRLWYISLNFMVGSLFNFGAVPFHQQIKECYYTLCNIGICSPKLAEYHL